MSTLAFTTSSISRKKCALIALGIFFGLVVLSVTTIRLLFPPKPTGPDLRRFPWVMEFYRELTPIAVEEAMRTGIPAPAIMAIAGHESGFGRGYVARVSGNILSLGARGSDVVLPPLTVLENGRGEILLEFDRTTRQQSIPSGYRWVKKPPSYKKDYRPPGICGTDGGFDYFIKNPAERLAAWRKNVRDFAEGRINEDSPVEAYRRAYQFARKMKNSHSRSYVFSERRAMEFIRLVGGHPQSFNSNPEWPDRVISLLRRAHLSEIAEDYYHGRNLASKRENNTSYAPFL